MKLAMKSGRMLLVYIEDVDSDSFRQGPASPIDPWIEWIEEEGEDFEKIRRSYKTSKTRLADPFPKTNGPSWTKLGAQGGLCGKLAWSVSTGGGGGVCGILATITRPLESRKFQASGLRLRYEAGVNRCLVRHRHSDHPLRQIR